ncbi:MAG: FAD-dependent oxidoreductase [Gammaproteobacteria bacterium]|nr:FAD-dependent oxidoreductase [Gammaproteobacteria bacterium]
MFVTYVIGNENLLNTKNRKVAVVGAGLLGRLLSLLLERQHEVTLFERGALDNEKTTGRLAAAMVAPVAESIVASEHIVSMGMQSTSLWRALLSALDLTALYQQQGTLVVAHPNDEADLRHFQRRLKVTVAEQALNINVLDHTGIQTLEPELQTTFQRGLFLPDEGHVLNHQLFDETSRRLQNSHIKLKAGCETRVCGKSVMYCSTPETQPITEQFDLVIDCRGLAAKHQLQNDKAKLRGVRGEVIRLRAPEVNISRPVRFMHPRYPIYIVPKPNDEYVIGATEIESEDEKRPSVRSTMELLSAAYSLHKGFAEAEIISIDAGLRPTLMDNEPQISVTNGLIQVNGLYRHGYLIAPYVLNQIVLLLNQQGITTQGFVETLPVLDSQLVVQLD